MKFLHIANTQFEWEFVQKKEISLEESFTAHPIFRQLQFLPLLYAKPHDGVMVTDLPSAEFLEKLTEKKINLPTLHLYEQDLYEHYDAIESWGASFAISKWAKEKKLNYVIPHWSVVREVNSKAFSFTHSPPLPFAELLHDEREAKKWLKYSGPKILKTCFGVSGRGHFFIDDSSFDEEKVLTFLRKEWEEGRPVIAEPWVNRLLDFSTQWFIYQDQKIDFVGATLCENDVRGRYKNNRVGDVSVLFGEWQPFFIQHRAVAESILKKVAQLGYFGNVGIDAMVYLWNHESLLHPIVEINARKTMGWVALQIQKKLFPHDMISIEYVPMQKGLDGLLPNSISKGTTTIKFPKQLLLQKLTQKSHK